MKNRGPGPGPDPGRDRGSRHSLPSSKLPGAHAGAPLASRRLLLAAHAAPLNAQTSPPAESPPTETSLAGKGLLPAAHAAPKLHALHPVVGTTACAASRYASCYRSLPS